MGTVEEERQDAKRWLSRQVSRPNAEKPRLPRPLFLVTGYTDESGTCWEGASSFLRYGQRIYRDWDRRAHRLVFPRDEVLGPRYGALAGRAMDSFVDFGDLLRAMMLDLEPDAARTDGGYDLLCHSMGGLNAWCALLEVVTVPPRTPPAAPGSLGRAHHFIALDTPFRGVPSMDFRRRMRTTAAQERQGAALFRTSRLLDLVRAGMADLPSRITRLTCYRPEGATQIEVPADSADLYGRTSEWATERAATHYEAPVIRGASHSGAMGITTSPITIRDVFETRLGVGAASPLVVTGPGARDPVS